MTPCKAMLLFLALLPFHVLSEDGIDCWQDVESAAVLSTSGGRFCREQEHNAAKAEMQRYFLRALLVAKREDMEDEKTLVPDIQSTELRSYEQSRKLG
ncbi:hypothetical protein [Nevskia sp.]|uniref:hypothetical protein n=1 Tax=Nevskia sp. TaxID=1929292 RepID=UPI003F6EBAF6